MRKTNGSDLDGKDDSNEIKLFTFPTWRKGVWSEEEVTFLVLTVQ